MNIQTVWNYCFNLLVAWASILQGIVSFFRSTNLDYVLYIINEYFTIAYVASVQCFLNSFNKSTDRNFTDDNVNLNLWPQRLF